MHLLGQRNTFLRFSPQAIHKAVEDHGAACFAKCGPSPTTNVTDCWTLCFYQTLLGRQPLPPFAKIDGAEPMAAAQLVGPFLNAFKPEGEGGCPGTPPSPSPSPVL